uniref:NADH dehydrogenase subunit 4L n=1 Tax=Cardiocondyla obscurior TaxID=286306 RepID=A0A343AXU0_9HYME|nr:NADH dehydrogenase subunit 4L [Cardiocondyla obscurior]
MFYDLVIYLQFMFILFILMSLVYKYILVILMLIELMVVNISLLLFLLMSLVEMEFYLIYYLVFSVCEGVLGLSLLVVNIRYYGSGLYFGMNMSKF